MNLSVGEYTSLGIFLFSFIGMLITTGWVSAWWLSKKFSGLTKQIDDQIDKLEANLIRKMEYHERHDDDRFLQIRNDLWEMKVQQAAKEGKISVTGRQLLSNSES